MLNRMTVGAGIASLFVAAAASAAFTPSDWAISSSGGSAGGGVVFSGGDTIMTLTSPNDGSGSPGQWNAVWAVTAGGAISFDWSVSSVDSGNFDTFGYTINGNYTQLANNTTPAGITPVNLVLNLGDVFGFRVTSADNVFGSLTANVTNFVPAPGAAALLGLAGLACRRRRA